MARPLGPMMRVCDQTAGRSQPPGPWRGRGGAKAFFEQGDDLLSDPPHETQGWYSVYDADLSTKVVLRAFAEGLATYVPGG